VEGPGVQRSAVAASGGAAWWWCAASTTDHGFDAKTGERKWSVARTTPALTLRNAPGMVINGANVYVAQPGGKLLALTAGHRPAAL
jgi:outer membrane protein assembly factor BamB